MALQDTVSTTNIFQINSVDRILSCRFPCRTVCQTYIDRGRRWSKETSSTRFKSVNYIFPLSELRFLNRNVLKLVCKKILIAEPPYYLQLAETLHAWGRPTACNLVKTFIDSINIASCFHCVLYASTLPFRTDQKITSAKWLWILEDSTSRFSHQAPQFKHVRILILLQVGIARRIVRKE